MSEEPSGRRIPGDDQVAVEMLLAVRAGDLNVVTRLLQDDPGLVATRPVAQNGGYTDSAASGS
jgi:hypothetical protein